MLIDILDLSIVFGHNCRKASLSMISASQCRAARGLLDWSQQELARRSNIGIVTVRQSKLGKMHRDELLCRLFAKLLKMGAYSS